MPWQEEEEEVTSGPWADIMEYSPVELEKLTTNRVSFPLTMLVHYPLALALFPGATLRLSMIF